MMCFDPNTLYSLEKLSEMLHGIVELPTLLDRLGLRDNRVFRDAIWGWEVIEASRKAEAFSEMGKVSTVGRVVGLSTSRPSHGRKNVPDPLRKLTAADLKD